MKVGKQKESLVQYAKKISVDEQFEKLKKEFSKKITIFTKKDEFYKKLLEIEEEMGHLSSKISRNNLSIDGIFGRNKCI